MTGRAEVRSALEIAFAAVSPSLPAAYENVPYTPIVGTPYAEVYLLTADPENAEISSDYTERGFLQVNLQYPLNAGAGPAETQAQIIRDAFPRGRSLTSGGVITTIQKTPSIGPGRAEADRYMLPVKIPFTAQIRS